MQLCSPEVGMDCLQTAGAEEIDGQLYQTAQPDELKDVATRLVRMYNSERQDEVLRLAANEMGVSSDQVSTWDGCACT